MTRRAEGAKGSAEKANASDKTIRFSREEYDRYVRSPECAAIRAIRSSRSCGWAKGKWIHVLDCESFERMVDPARNCMSIERAPKHDFNWVVVELFPRTTEPDYRPGEVECNRYLTWQAANGDIEKQRRKGYRGPRYLVLVRLYDANFRKCTVRREEPRFSERDGYWVGKGDRLHTTKPKPWKVVEGPEPDWRHRVVDSRKLDAKDLKRIRNTREEILQAIRKAGRPRIEMFGLS